MCDDWRSASRDRQRSDHPQRSTRGARRDHRRAQARTAKRDRDDRFRFKRGCIGRCRRRGPGVRAGRRARPWCIHPPDRLNQENSHEMGNARQREGRQGRMPLAHSHIHRQRGRVFVRSSRPARERRSRDRCHSLRHVARRARPPRRGMLVRRNRQDVRHQGRSDRPPGNDRARGGHATARSDPAIPGLEAIAEGFKRLAVADGYDDHETIRREKHLYDALYLYCGGQPAKLRRD